MTPDKYIYFIRHGQSADNIAHVFQGPDSELTPLGHRQAKFVAHRMKSLPIEVILASTMARALQTATYIHTETSVPLETHAMLREYLAPSALLGTPHDTEKGKEYLREMVLHYEDPDWHYADEDSYFDLQARSLEVLDHLISRPETHIAVVTHAGFMRVIIGTMLAEGEADPRTTRRLARFLAPVNTGITVCRYRKEETRRNKWRMISWNDHAHLADTDKEEPAESPV
jgi:probable phosphoglycerate mutase